MGCMRLDTLTEDKRVQKTAKMTSMEHLLIIADQPAQGPNSSFSLM